MNDCQLNMREIADAAHISTERVFNIIQEYEKLIRKNRTYLLKTKCE